MVKKNGKRKCRCTGHHFPKQLWWAGTGSGKRASDGLHSFCQPLPHGGLYFIQHGKLRNRKCIHYRPQKLPFADGSSRLRTWVGSCQKKRRLKHCSALFREENSGVFRKSGSTGKCSRFPEMAERKIRCYGGHQHCLQFWFQRDAKSAYRKRRRCYCCLYQTADSGRRQKLLRENQLSALHLLHGRTEDQQDLCKLGGKRSTECIDEYLRDGASASDRRNQKRLCPWK